MIIIIMIDYCIIFIVYDNRHKHWLIRWTTVKGVKGDSIGDYIRLIEIYS